MEVGGSNRQAIHQNTQPKRLKTGRLGRSPRPAFPSGSVGAVEKLKVPRGKGWKILLSKFRQKNTQQTPVWRRISPNFGSYQRLLTSTVTAHESATIQSLKTEPALAHPAGGHRQVPLTFFRRLRTTEVKKAGNSQKIQTPLPYKLPVCYVCMYVIFV